MGMTMNAFWFQYCQAMFLVRISRERALGPTEIEIKHLTTAQEKLSALWEAVSGLPDDMVERHAALVEYEEKKAADEKAKREAEEKAAKTANWNWSSDSEEETKKTDEVDQKKPPPTVAAQLIIYYVVNYVYIFVYYLQI